MVDIAGRIPQEVTDRAGTAHSGSCRIWRAVGSPGEGGESTHRLAASRWRKLESIDGDRVIVRRRNGDKSSSVLVGSCAVLVGVAVPAIGAEADVVDRRGILVLLLEVGALSGEERFEVRLCLSLLGTRLKSNEVGNDPDEPKRSRVDRPRCTE